MTATSPLLIVHGGVSGTPKEHHSLAAAVTAGLAEEAAVEAVQAAVLVLEDDPSLNAGFGSALSRVGTPELDAGIADGSARRFGGVANVRVKNPILLARAVMEETPHVLLAGSGASDFARKIGLPVLADTTPRQRDRFERAASRDLLGSERFGQAESIDTVGAIALDQEGRLAAASSTGGVFGKMPGRVGDAPVFGAGFFAADDVAVVGTGIGEEFLRIMACLRVGDRVVSGLSPQQACESVVEEIVRDNPQATAGLLALDGGGRVGAAYRGAAWSIEGPNGRIDATGVS